MNESAAGASVRMLCPACGAVNRLPFYRIHDWPRCGRCAQPLLPGQVAQLGGRNLLQLIECSELPTVVGVWPREPAYGRLSKVYDQAARALQGQAQLFHVDGRGDDFVRLGFQVREFPTLLVLHRGHVRARRVGAGPLNELEAWLREQL